MGSKYKAGVPELGLPALDPLVVYIVSVFREEKLYIYKYIELGEHIFV